MKAEFHAQLSKLRRFRIHRLTPDELCELYLRVEATKNMDGVPTADIGRWMHLEMQELIIQDLLNAQTVAPVAACAS